MTPRNNWLSQHRAFFAFLLLKDAYNNVEYERIGEGWGERKDSHFKSFMVTVDKLVHVLSGDSGFWNLSQGRKSSVWGLAFLGRLESLFQEGWTFPGHCCKAQGSTGSAAW